MGNAPDEVPLMGGLTNPGAVVRVGDHVLRPATTHSSSVHALLAHVRDNGFTGAPEPIGFEADGRERLSFIDGDVPASPYPAWSQTDEALTSIARLLRRFHDVSDGFDQATHAWSDVLADPTPDREDLVMCHNDVELGNVVFRDRVAVALIDFEFAAPGRREYDLAQFARTCVPIEHEFDRARMAWNVGDPSTRLRLIADAYGLDASGRAELLRALHDAMVLVEELGLRTASSGNKAVADHLAATGGIEKYDRRRDWWARHETSLVQALG